MTISRGQGSLTFPANFMLVGARNPCPCGFFGAAEKDWTCSGTMVTRYRSASQWGAWFDRMLAPVSQSEEGS